MDYFEMQKYYSQYVTASANLRQIHDRIERMKQPAVLPDGTMLVANQEGIAAAEAEAAALAPEVDNLYCLGHYGKTRAELEQAEMYQTIGLQPSGHWPGR